ncbi:FecR family protein [Mucilaginibacter sp. SP1R1]|uniref:FecR family protein n=1 Tax=Mucilaginibacter sp. SP1R1 TaxID=2723091 RepID=UPI00180EB47E|nr:FecR family protein [Mucilaginibacter sp. SP1R1]MBB6148631.1 ferric-dicitrate binding protein FerR (iron transport regulator) [Mucilaginibacter sp. SP1R1]
MITKNEFLALYEKYNNGLCTPAEKELLDNYRDEISLLEDGWDNDLAKEDDVHNRIWQKLSDSRKIVKLPERKVNKYRWLQVAAILLIALFAGLLLVEKYKTASAPITLSTKTKPLDILPGGNKAYLTMADGSRIILNDAKNGNLVSKPGITVSKTQNGTLVYSFSKAPATAEPEFNTITTPRGGQYQIVLEDGTKVWLNAASSIRFPQAFTGKQREVELSGEAYFEVAKNKAKPFIVQANGTQIQVLGTHFNINAYNDDNNITTTLLEGSVRMTSGASVVMLIPGQQGVAVKSGEAIKISTADMQQTMAWKNGLFVFHDANIVDIMKQVSRWYDVDVEYQGDVQNNEFGGTISKYKNITDLLNIMELTRSIHYKFEGRRVIIMK